MASSQDVQPHDEASYLNGGDEGGQSLGISRCDTTPLLDLEDCGFNQMPLFVEVLIIFTLLLSVLARRDDGVYASRRGCFHNLIAVIPLVRNQVLRLDSFDKRICLAAICPGSLCSNDSERHTMRIHGQMYLGVEPPFVRFMPSLPPSAPLACGWTLQ